MHNQTKSLRLGLMPSLLITFATLSLYIAEAKAQSLGSAETFAALAATTLTNTGVSHISGNVGVSPGTAITGFPPGIITNGALHAGDATAAKAHADFATAYAAFAALASPPANNLTGADLGGKTLFPGVYRYNVAATSNGALTLDAQNNPNARFVIQIGTTLITSSGSSVILLHGADARNVYFQVGTSATLASGSSFIGNILAHTSITTVSGAAVTGRLLALTGAVTLDTNNSSSPGLSAAQLLNISTRLKVLTADNVAIAGFIITGSAPKKVLVRGIGPSLTAAHITGVLANPVLELHASNGSLITTNDNWHDTQAAAIIATTIPPTNNFESAIVATLAPGRYSAILSGKNGGTGVGLVEMYDLSPTSNSALANISTRGFVQTGNDVMIAGFIFGNGFASEKVIVRALGPSLATSHVANVLADPTLDLHNANGALLMSNDNWKDNPAQAALIVASTIPPKNNFESAMVTTLAPGRYTAIVRGKNGTTGVALAEMYHLH